MQTGREGGTLKDKRGLIFLGVVFICFLQAGLHVGRHSRVTGEKWLLSSFSRSRPIVDEHPIPLLMAEAEANFRSLLSRQSNTLKKAVLEYRSRYDRDPPKGFDEWWQFTQENNVKIIDDYDGLMEDLAPFWDMSGEEFRLRAEAVGLGMILYITKLKTPVGREATFYRHGQVTRRRGFRPKH